MSRTTFHLEIITPVARKYGGEVTTLVAPGVLGEMAILANHAPLFSILQPGLLRYREDGQFREMAVGEGFLQVAENRARCVVASAEFPHEVDPERARRKVEDARARLEAGGEKLDLAVKDRLRQRIRHNEVRLRIAHARTGE